MGRSVKNILSAQANLYPDPLTMGVGLFRVLVDFIIFPPILALWVILGWRLLPRLVLHVGEVIEEKKPRELTAVFSSTVEVCRMSSLHLLESSHICLYFVRKCLVGNERTWLIGSIPLVRNWGSLWCLL